MELIFEGGKIRLELSKEESEHLIRELNSLDLSLENVRQAINKKDLTDTSISNNLMLKIMLKSKIDLAKRKGVL